MSQPGDGRIPKHPLNALAQGHLVTRRGARRAARVLDDDHRVDVGRVELRGEKAGAGVFDGDPASCRSNARRACGVHRKSRFATYLGFAKSPRTASQPAGRSDPSAAQPHPTVPRCLRLAPRPASACRPSGPEPEAFPSAHCTQATGPHGLGPSARPGVEDRRAGLPAARMWGPPPPRRRAQGPGGHHRCARRSSSRGDREGPALHAIRRAPARTPGSRDLTSEAPPLVVLEPLPDREPAPPIACTAAPGARPAGPRWTIGAAAQLSALPNGPVTTPISRSAQASDRPRRPLRPRGHPRHGPGEHLVVPGRR